MKNLLLLAGRVIFWLAWPVLWIYLRRGSRTRLLLICGDEFLALRGWFGARNGWTLPGGGLHKNEAPVSGLIREVQEETGIILDKKLIKPACIGTSDRYGLKFSYVSFTVELDKKPDVKIQRLEIADYAWLPIDNLELPLAQDVAQILRWHKKTKSD